MAKTRDWTENCMNVPFVFCSDLLGSICDLNELPSKSVNLQPEFSQHPWMLEQVSRPLYFADCFGFVLLVSLCLGEGGHLDLLHGFPSPKCVSVSVHVCARLSICNISYSFSPVTFKFSDMVTMKINFVYAIFPTVLCQWLSNSQIW